MTPTHTGRGGRRYRYYACSTAQKRGRDACPTKPVPAGAAEAAVVSRVRAGGRDPALLAEVVEALSRDGTPVDAAAAADTLAAFDPLWEALTAAERGRALSLLLDRVAYDAAAGTLSLTVRPDGFAALHAAPPTAA